MKLLSSKASYEIPGLNDIGSGIHSWPCSSVAIEENIHLGLAWVRYPQARLEVTSLQPETQSLGIEWESWFIREIFICLYPKNIGPCPGPQTAGDFVHLFPGLIILLPAPSMPPPFSGETLAVLWTWAVPLLGAAAPSLLFCISNPLPPWGPHLCAPTPCVDVHIRDSCTLCPCAVEGRSVSRFLFLPQKVC